MNSIKLVLNLSPHGLHARPCTLLVSLLKECFRDHEVLALSNKPLTGEETQVDAKSVLGLISLEVRLGGHIEFISPMPDGQWKALVAILTSLFYGKSSEDEDNYDSLLQILKVDCRMGSGRVGSDVIAEKLKSVGAPRDGGYWFSVAPSSALQSPEGPAGWFKRWKSGFARTPRVADAAFDSQVARDAGPMERSRFERTQTDLRPGDFFDVFLSFASGDKEVAEAICAFLEDQGVRCWMAPRDVQPGVNYGEALIDAINSSRVMILVLSSESNKSPHVAREVERSASKGLPIIPFRIEDVVLSKSLEYFISSNQRLDAVSRPLAPHLNGLAQTTLKLLGRAAPPPSTPKIAAKASPSRPIEAFRILPYLSPETVLICPAQKDKNGLLEDLVARLCRYCGWADVSGVLARFHCREQGISTTLDMGLSLPHVRLDRLSDLDIVAALGVASRGIPDTKQPELLIRVMLLFCSPNRPEGFSTHMRFLRTATRLFQSDFIDQLARAATPAAVLEMIRKAEG